MVVYLWENLVEKQCASHVLNLIIQDGFIILDSVSGQSRQCKVY